MYQEVCIQILEHRGKYREQGTMGGWIGTVAHRVARNWSSSRSAQQSVRDRYGAEIEPFESARQLAQDPLRLLETKELLTNVNRTLDSMPSRQAEAFRLVYINGYTRSEAARIMNVTTGTVRSNLRHAKKRLAEEVVVG